MVGNLVATPGRQLPADDDVHAIGTTPQAENSDLRVFFGFVGWAILYSTALFLVMMRSFQVRWRVAD